MTPQEQEYRTIVLTQGQVALVDAADFVWLSRWKWYARWSKKTQSFYAMRNSTYRRGEKRSTVLMHRQILGLEWGDPREGDHRETGKTLDNRMANLRIAATVENRRNTRRRNNTSGFKGVTAHKPTGRWKAMISVNSEKVYLGMFDTKEKAYAAYCAGAKKYHGEFARLA